MAVPYNKILIKTDKDGTEHYRVDACPKCGGTGYLRGYEHIDNARCWKCNASGYYPYTFIVKSEARLEKERIRNKKKLMAQAPKHNEEFMADHGFNSDGITYVVLGNTYEIKEQIKEVGGKFDYIMGWAIPQDNSEWDTIAVNIDEVADKDENGWYRYKDSAEIAKILDCKENEFKKEHEPENETVSEYVGNIGDKVNADVEFVSAYTYDTHYSYYGGTSTIFKFKDKNGNIFIWNTSSYPNIENGKSYSITAIVKDHKEYKGEKETVLTRCKVKC